MKIPTPKDRPDYFYWTTPRAKRPKLSQDEMAALMVDMANYSHQRFPVGRRLKLVKDYCGIPKGTGVTVVIGWPNTTVRWDKWSRAGYGALRKESTVSFELDCNLEIIDAGS